MKSHCIGITIWHNFVVYFFKVKDFQNLKRENIFFNQAALNLDHFPGVPGVNYSWWFIF